MSWETLESRSQARCACGKGTVVQIKRERSDDWNRSQRVSQSEEILCADCKTKYHIQHLVRHYPCRPWDGDGILDRVFLVPIGMEMPSIKYKRVFSFSTVEEIIVSSFPLKRIKAAIDDMSENKYTTRLQLKESRSIVGLFERYRKTRSLKIIVPVLAGIVQNHTQYEWTPETIEDYRKKEELEIQKNESDIQKIISHSFELFFR